MFYTLYLQSTFWFGTWWLSGIHFKVLYLFDAHGSFICGAQTSMLRVSPQGESPPWGSAAPGAHSPAGSTGCWIGTGCTPGPFHPSGRCVNLPTGPERRCWWYPRYPSPGCCLDPASHRHPEAPSGMAAETTGGNKRRSTTYKSQDPTCVHCCPHTAAILLYMNRVIGRILCVPHVL